MQEEVGFRPREVIKTPGRYAQLYGRGTASAVGPDDEEAEDLPAAARAAKKRRLRKKERREWLNQWYVERAVTGIARKEQSRT
jgi:hypothetical protein